MAKPKKKIDLKVEAQETPDFEGKVTDEVLLDLCPPEFLAEFKKAKSLGQRVDFLYVADKHRLEVQKDVDKMKKFLSALERLFIQSLPNDDATGIAGEVARVQVIKKERPSVKDWAAFYVFIGKTRSFELLNRAPNAKSIKERWDVGVQIPGVEKFQFKDVSVTKVK